MIRISLSRESLELSRDCIMEILASGKNSGVTEGVLTQALQTMSDVFTIRSATFNHCTIVDGPPPKGGIHDGEEVMPKKG